MDVISFSEVRLLEVSSESQSCLLMTVEVHQSGELESLLAKHDIIPKIAVESSSERS